MLKASVMKKFAGELGAVRKKVKVAPALAVTSDASPPPIGPYVGIAKSVERAVVTPSAFRTVTVHVTTSRTRIILVDLLVCPTHDKTDDVDGIPKKTRKKKR